MLPNRRLFGLVGLLLAGLGCASPKPSRLRVGSKTGTDQVVLGEILARHIENKLNTSVERTFNLAGTAVAHEALAAGQLDLYAEDAASAVSQVLRMDLGSEAMATFNLCRQQYANMLQIDWLDPLGIEAPIVLVGRKEMEEQVKGKTISQLAAAQIPLRLAAPREFTGRSDGYSKMQTVYNVRLRDAPRIANTAKELFQLLDEKQVDLVATEATNGYLTGDRYLVFEDDKGVFQVSLTAVVIRRDVGSKLPGVDAALKQLSGKLSLSIIRRLAQEVDTKNRRPAEVAAEFLRSQGL